MNEIKDLNILLNKYAKESSSVRNSRILVNGNLLYTSIVGCLNNKEVYGVLPTMSVDKIKKELIEVQESPLLTEKRFEEYLKLNIKEWSWGDKKIPQEGDLAEALLGKCLLSIVNQFYVDISVDSARYNYNEFVESLNSMKIYHQLIKEDNNEIIIRIHGRLTKEQEEVLDNKYYINKIQEKLIISNINSNDFKFEILYKELTCSHYLYSGVITNIDNIEFMPINEANRSLSQIKTKISKTTFATVIGLGHPQLSDDEGKIYKMFYLKEHPLLTNYIEKLDNVDKDEGEKQSKLFSALNNLEINDDEILKEINGYLCDSYYPHIISIAGNVTTSDNYNLFLSRGLDVEQENLYSCAVTGYSEINDTRVQFYNYSVEDDKPSISINSELITLNGEFVRETRAELGITTEIGEWRNYGIIVSGKEANLKRSNKSGKIQPLTVDFEVAAQVNTRYSLDEIIDKHKSAIERGEANNIYGIKFNIYENKGVLIKNSIVTFLQEISKGKDLILIAFLIIVNIKAMVSEKKGIMDVLKGITTDLLGGISFFINIVLVILFILDFIKILNSKKNKHKININNSKFKISKVNNKFSKDIKTENSSYLFASMMNLYLIALKNQMK
ncbi:hypothetical protein [Clostridium folliculivorans]|uniref:hypothetical protein n=1 Tax=Clostridium folliculivorans TaxID=2886038 RepID=UPI0021C33357|nr:hypothetical protein [Clostridium folliculivorans]GKU29286.1 hypothetical protein CFB3_13920 [Clostridium folliculivorans]